MRRFRLRQDSLPKGMAYPLRRCALDAMFDVGDVNVVRNVTFHAWPGRPLFEALFFGVSRRSPSAGGCEIHINAVPRRDLKKVEALLQGEGMPVVLHWLQATARAAVSKPQELFHWNARISKGALRISHDADAP